MNTKTLLTSVTLAPIFAAAALAHGPQLRTKIENNTVVTYGVAADTANYGEAAPVQRYYTIPLTQRGVGDSNDGWYATPNSTYAFTGPGLMYGNGGFNGGVTITETIADGLKLWNGTSFIDPGNEQIQGFRGNLATPTATFNTVDNAIGGNTSLTTSSPVAATAHATVAWRLLGDGVSSNTASDDGMYLLTLQLSTNQSGVSASEPFYFLLNKNASSSDVAGAQAFAAANLPEPASLAVVGLGACGLLARRRRA